MQSDNKRVIIYAIEVEQLSNPETTYNFEVEDFHTYYVTESKVLVHNACKYFEANKVGDNYEIGKEIDQKQALNRLRNNESVWVDSRSGARSLAKKIGIKGKAMRHLNHDIGYYKHFHDGAHAFGGHVIYGSPVF